MDSSQYQWVNKHGTYELNIGMFRLDVRPYSPHGSLLYVWANGQIIVNHFFHAGQDQLAIKEYALGYMHSILAPATHDLAEYRNTLHETSK